MKTKIGVKILPREVLLDTQGRAVEQTLKAGSILTPSANKDIHVRVGKYIELEFQLSQPEALKEAETIAKKVLTNPLIEQFSLEVLQG